MISEYQHHHQQQQQHKRTNKTKICNKIIFSDLWSTKMESFWHRVGKNNDKI